MILFSAIMLWTLFCGAVSAPLGIKTKAPTPAPPLVGKTKTTALPTVTPAPTTQVVATVPADNLLSIEMPPLTDTIETEVTLLPNSDNTTTVASNITTSGQQTSNSNENATSTTSDDQRVSFRRMIALIIAGVLFLIVFMLIVLWWCCLGGEHSTRSTPNPSIGETTDPVYVGGETDGVKDITAVEFRHANLIRPLLINTNPVPTAGPSGSVHDYGDLGTPLMIHAPPAISPNVAPTTAGVADGEVH